MYFLECNANLEPVIRLLNIVIRAIQIGVPLVLIILGSIDLGKAVIANKDDEVKKAQKTFIRRLLYAVAVFLVVWIVQLVMTTVPTLFGNKKDQVGGTENYKGCLECVFSPDSCFK